MRRIVPIVALVLGLAACGRDGPPAPVRMGGEPPPAPAEKPAAAARSARPAAAETAVHVVERGDTVYGIARAYRVPLRAVIEANGLEPPYLLRVGQRLTVPQPRRHVVERGDTVYGISRRYGVDMRALARLNDLAPPYTITPGQVLRLPAAGEGARVAAAEARPARRTDRGGSEAQTEKQPQRTSRAEAPTARARPAAIPQPPARGGGKFLWPLRGRVIARYGPQDGGLHNDGINIAAPRGTPVRAAENGVVAYAGNELRGFGKLLLVKHAGGWVTAYAHNGELLVGRGEEVRRGQPIARVGASGSVSAPQLHFEVRRGTRALDPLGLLGPQTAAG